MKYCVLYLAIGILAAILRPKSWDARTAFPATVLLWLPAFCVVGLGWVLAAIIKEGNKR